MTKIVSFSGISNSGKTTLIRGLCDILAHDFRIAVIKHDPKNKVTFDTIGKDSYQFFESGADIALVSPTQTTIRFHHQLQSEDILNIFEYRKNLDYLFIEGFKTMPFRRICVVRDKFEQSEIDNSQAIATTRELFDKFEGKTMLDLNNHEQILQWIDSQIW